MEITRCPLLLNEENKKSGLYSALVDTDLKFTPSWFAQWNQSQTLVIMVTLEKVKNGAT